MKTVREIEPQLEYALSLGLACGLLPEDQARLEALLDRPYEELGEEDKHFLARVLSALALVRVQSRKAPWWAFWRR